MSRRSTVTSRHRPVQDVTTVSGPSVVHGEVLTVQTGERVQLLDLTERVMALVRGAGIREGLVSVFSLHTTSTVFINEFQNALIADVVRFLERIVDQEGDWLHNDPAHSDCDRMNADSHLRALLLGHSVTLQVSGGEVVLGQWQRILLAELDGPRERSVRVTVMGVA